VAVKTKRGLRKTFTADPRGGKKCGGGFSDSWLSGRGDVTQNVKPRQEKKRKKKNEDSRPFESKGEKATKKALRRPVGGERTQFERERGGFKRGGRGLG